MKLALNRSTVELMASTVRDALNGVARHAGAFFVRWNRPIRASGRGEE